MQKGMSFNDAAIGSFKANEYGIHIWYVSNDKAIYLLRNDDLTEKSGIF